jgi:hypothetical protein
MFQQIGYILLAFLIAFLCFKGLLFLLKENYGIEFPTGEEIFLSENRGEDWIAIKTAAKQNVGGNSIVFDPQNSQNLYLASAEGIFKSESKGKKFTAKATEFQTETKPALISEFITDPQDPNIIYLLSEEMGRNKILVSYNRGENFKPIFISGEDDKITAFSPDPFSSRYLYIGTKKGVILKSEDFGHSWKKKEDFGREIKQIAVNPHKRFVDEKHKTLSPRFAAGTEYREIYIVLPLIKSPPYSPPPLSETPAKTLISRDWGESFNEFKPKIDSPKNITLPEIKEIIFDPNLENRVYFISDFLLLRLKGNKVEIVKVIFPSQRNKINVFTIDPENSNILYLGAEGLIYLSENGGDDWQIIEPPVRGKIKEIKINPIDPNMLLLSITETW